MVHCSLVYEGKQKILGLELFANFKMFFFLSFTRLGLSRMAIFQKKEKKKLQCPNSPPLPPTAHCSRPPLLRRTHNTFQIFCLSSGHLCCVAVCICDQYKRVIFVGFFGKFCGFLEHLKKCCIFGYVALFFVSALFFAHQTSDHGVKSMGDISKWVQGPLFPINRLPSSVMLFLHFGS